MKKKDFYKLVYKLDYGIIPNVRSIISVMKSYDFIETMEDFFLGRVRAQDLEEMIGYPKKYSVNISDRWILIYIMTELDSTDKVYFQRLKHLKKLTRRVYIDDLDGQKNVRSINLHDNFDWTIPFGDNRVVNKVFFEGKELKVGKIGTFKKAFGRIQKYLGGSTTKPTVADLYVTYVNGMEYLDKDNAIVMGSFSIETPANDCSHRINRLRASFINKLPELNYQLDKKIVNGRQQFSLESYILQGDNETYVISTYEMATIMKRVIDGYSFIVK